MDATGPISRLQHHRQWANQMLRRACREVLEAQLRQPCEIGQGSLWATLVHLYGAEKVWLDAIDGQPDSTMPGPDDFANLDELEAAWDRVDQRWQIYQSRLGREELDRPVERINSRTGQTSAIPLSDVLLHVCMHAQYTMAQAINCLRQLGMSENHLPDTQLITLSRFEHVAD